MSVAKKLFLYTIYGLIKIGDIVLYAISLTKNIAIKIAGFITEASLTYLKLLLLGPIVVYERVTRTFASKIVLRLAHVYYARSATKGTIQFENLEEERNITKEQPIVYSRKKSNIFKSLFKRKRKVGRPLKKKTNGSFSAILARVKFFTFGAIFSFIFIFLPLLVFVFASDLPNPHSLSVTTLPKTTKIYDRKGELLYEIYANQNRTVAKLIDIPKTLQDATIAVEDKDFYSHPGFDVRGIIRAALSNVQNNELQGGSTITQQLIKSAYLTPTPTFQRKIKELVLAFWAERVYTKRQILELYFNYAPYGGTAWGIESASEVYFGKNVKDLDLAQSAFLAGMPKAPSIYSPYSSIPKAWKKRQKEVLDAMVRTGALSKKQADDAYGEKLTFRPQQVPIKAPHFVMYVKDLLVKKYGLSEVERGGLRVTTTLDLDLQDKAQAIVTKEVENNTYLHITNGAALITNPKTGELLAMIGGKDYFEAEFDGNVNLTNSLRQPGSAIKLITYTLGIASGKYTDATILDDSALVIPLSDGRVYSPVNYDGRFHGRIPLRLAFGNSFNIPAVRVARELGVDNIVSFGQQMGITSWSSTNNYGLSITLGGADVTMLDLATAFGTVANKGIEQDIDPFIEIKDSQGKQIYKRPDSNDRVVSEGVAFIVSDILADPTARLIEFGSNTPLIIPNHRVSVKTGTSDNKRDNWTVGYTNDLLVATWVGNNDNSPMSQQLASGITGAAPMWNKIMSTLLEGKKDPELYIPDNVIKKNCLGRDYYFIRGTENSVNCTSPSPSTAPLSFPTSTPTIMPTEQPNNFLLDLINRKNNKKRQR